MGVDVVHDIPVDGDEEEGRESPAKREELPKRSILRSPVIAPILWLINVAAVAAILFGGYMQFFAAREVEAPARKRISTISNLLPLKVVVSDFASVDSGGVKALYHIKGDALIGVDLSGVQVSDLGNGKVTLSGLPQPHVSRARVDGEATELIDQKRGLFTSQKSVGEMHNLVLEEAERRIRVAASSEDVANTARRRAEALLGAMYSRMGYKVESFGWTGRGAK